MQDKDVRIGRAESGETDVERTRGWCAQDGTAGEERFRSVYISRYNLKPGKEPD
jgi:hypothetical protein